MPTVPTPADIPTPEDATALERLTDARDRLCDIVVSGKIAQIRADGDLRHVRRDAGLVMALADEVRVRRRAGARSEAHRRERRSRAATTDAAAATAVMSESLVSAS
jgi:hypothetical protein